MFLEWSFSFNTTHQPHSKPPFSWHKNKADGGGDEAGAACTSVCAGILNTVWIFWHLVPGQWWDKALNPLNAKLKPICHMLALLGAHHILSVSRIRVNICKAVSSSYYASCVTFQRRISDGWEIGEFWWWLLIFRRNSCLHLQVRRDQEGGHRHSVEGP